MIDYCFDDKRRFEGQVPVKNLYFIRNERYGYATIIPKGLSIEYATVFREKELSLLEKIDGKKTCKDYMLEFDLSEVALEEMMHKFLSIGIVTLLNNENIEQGIISELFPNNIHIISSIISKGNVFINSDSKVLDEYNEIGIRSKMFNRSEIFMLYIEAEDKRLISIKNTSNEFIAEIGVWEMKHDAKDLIVIEKAIDYFIQKYSPKKAIKIRINYQNSDRIPVKWKNRYVISDEYGFGNSKFIVEHIYGKEK